VAVLEADVSQEKDRVASLSRENEEWFVTHAHLQHTATHCDTLRHAATCYNTWLHTATRCNTLQHTAIH